VRGQSEGEGDRKNGGKGGRVRVRVKVRVSVKMMIMDGHCSSVSWTAVQARYCLETVCVWVRMSVRIACWLM
jgi:hypothetical protein